MDTKALVDTINLIKDKDFKIYFFTVDTMGHPSASVEYLYRAALALSKQYDVHILYEPNKDGSFIGVKDWLGEEYSNLPHTKSTDKDFNITTADVIFIPEIFSHLMDSLKNVPCHKIVLSQMWTAILQYLGSNTENVEEFFDIKWDKTYKITDVITTSAKQENYIKGLFPNTNIKVVEPVISNDFKNKTKLKKPIVAILSRNQHDTDKLVKAFYTKYPIYKWIAFKNMKGLSKVKFAKELDECCLAVWMDTDSSFGTFPLEAMKCNVPVMGLVPDMVPVYMEDGDVIKNNAIWVRSKHDMHTFIAEYITSWVKDGVPEQLLNNNEDYYENLTEENFDTNFISAFEEFVKTRSNDLKNAVKEIEETNKLTEIV